MRFFAVCLVALALASSANAEKLLLLNNSREIPQSQDPLALWSLDTVSLKAEKLTESSYDMPAWSASVFCNNSYFASYADFNSAAWGVMQYSLTDKKWGGNILSDYLYHALACLDDQLYGVGTRPREQGGVEYSIRKLNPDTLDDKQMLNLTSITTYWDGYDNIFSFSEDGYTLWASFPVAPKLAKNHGGLLVEVDLKNWKVTGQQKYDTHAEPYFLVPPSKGSSKSFAIMKYFSWGGDIVSLNFDPVTFSSSNVKIKKGKEVDFMWASSQPQKLCNGVIYSLGLAHEEGQPPQYLFGMDAQTGEEVLNINLEDVIPGAFVGGLSCV